MNSAESGGASAAMQSLRLEVVPDWPLLPGGLWFLDVPALEVAASGDVHMFTRYPNRVVVVGENGNLVRTWGEGTFTGPHGYTLAPDGSCFCIDYKDHSVRKFGPDGSLLMTLGVPGRPSDTGYDGVDIRSVTKPGIPFNRPTALVAAENGDLFVTDGYGNACVHHFNSTGDLLKSWGRPGSAPGEFRLPHHISWNCDGSLLVSDRENERLQIFTPAGQFVTEWTDVQRPTAAYCDSSGRVFVAELFWRRGDYSCRQGIINEDLPARISVLDQKGRVMARFQGTDPCGAGSFVAPHDLAITDDGYLYVGEAPFTTLGQRGLAPVSCHSVQKLRIVTDELAERAGMPVRPDSVLAHE
jgi:hypothetical protein